ncbi:MAG: GGDEF domain-containing protein [Gammaproteobacteria bacterium]|nr:GGDEF domain-containing protein [Gammaproteobacteria bacterium]
MPNKILQSVVDITKQRDLDSLEYSLVATLADILPVVGISILKTLKDGDAVFAEEVVRLIIDKQQKQSYSWSVDANIIATEDNFHECIKLSNVIIYKHEEGFTRHLFPIDDASQAIGCLVIDSTEDLSSQLELIKGFSKIYQNYMIIFNESERDKLTGLFNRRTFDNKLSKLFKSHKHKSKLYSSSNMQDRRQYDHDATAWLIITDIDHFKRVNDTHGHVFGDEVILTISQIMKSCFRNSDLLFRVGGEEFVILLEPVRQKVAEKLIEKFRKTISEHQFSQIGAVTVSAGYTRICEKDYPPSVLEHADRALYFAKEHGRNCSYNYEKLIKQGKIISAKKGGSVDLF